MDTHNAATVSCPACSDAREAVRDSSGRCRYCNGASEVSELAAVEFEKTLLEIKLKRQNDELTRLRAEAALAHPVIRACQRWRDAGCAATHEVEVFIALNKMEDEQSALKAKLDKASRETAVWLHAMAENTGVW